MAAQLTDHDKACRLFSAIGAIHADANPDGFIATALGRTPEQRLASIWETVQELEQDLGLKLAARH